MVVSGGGGAAGAGGGVLFPETPFIHLRMI